MRVKRRPGWPVRSEVAPANGTAARLEGKIYASWLDLIVTVRHWAGTIHGDIDSNRGRLLTVLSGRLDALQLVKGPIKRSLDRSLVARQFAECTTVFSVKYKSGAQ